MRKVNVKRKTGETEVEGTLNLDGEGKYDVNTDYGFLNHMLELFARHGGFDLCVNAMGDTQVDFHHTT